MHTATNHTVKRYDKELSKLREQIARMGDQVSGQLSLLLNHLETGDPDKFEEELGVAVLATIPKVYQRKDISLKRLNQLLTAVSIVVAVGLTAGFAVPAKVKRHHIVAGIEQRAAVAGATVRVAPELVHVPSCAAVPQSGATLPPRNRGLGIRRRGHRQQAQEDL